MLYYRVIVLSISYNVVAVAKPSSSGGIPQVKQSGLKPPTRKRMALKTSQTTRSSVEPIQTQSCNKPTTALPGTIPLSIFRFY